MFANKTANFQRNLGSHSDASAPLRLFTWNYMIDFWSSTTFPTAHSNAHNHQAETKIKGNRISRCHSLSPVKLTARKMVIASFVRPTNQTTDQPTDQLYLFSMVFAPSFYNLMWWLAEGWTRWKWKKELAQQNRCRKDKTDRKWTRARHTEWVGWVRQRS